jgi:dCTP deaminase
MAVLNRSQIEGRLFREANPERRIVATPLLDPKGQIGGNSLDVRLGNYFITHRRPNVSDIDPNDAMLAERRAEIEEETFVPTGEYFVLHPRQFAIGGTLEYIGMPLDLVAYVTGKSSWGRLGLVIATAAGIHAWFRGIIALELANVGEIPLLLYPGRPIAQLFFHETAAQPFDKADVSGHFAAVQPEGSRMKPDQNILKFQIRSGQSS